MKLDRAIKDWVEDHRKRIIDFACDLISIPSINPPGDETRIHQVLKDQIENFGIRKQKTIALKEERPNLISEIEFKNSGPALMLNGHMDTKPPGDLGKWLTDPFTPEIRNGILYGLGSVDMKSAIAAMIYSAGALKEFEKDLSGKLMLVFNADEEAGGEFGAKYIAKNAKLKADIGLIGEPTGITKDWENLYLVSRGETCFRITVFGTQMHSSISDRLPSVNANLLAAETMLKTRDNLKINYEPHPYCPDGITMTVGVLMKGGVFYGILPGKAEFSIEIRTIPGMNKKSVRKDIEAFIAHLKKENPDLKIEWDFETEPLDWIKPVEVKQDHPFVDVLENSVKQVLPEVPPKGAFPAWTDARFFSDLAGIPTIPAFGPGLLTQAHKPNEHIGLKSIIQAAKIYALAAAEYLRASE